MTWRTLRRVSALMLAAVLGITFTAPSLAVEVIGDGVAPTYDEAYYATLDYYGNLLEGSMVKSYALNGAESLTDYGVYDEVINLTDYTEGRYEDGRTVFQFDGTGPEHFYFEGKTRAPFENLPWTVSLRYTMNGVPAKAEDLAGQQGVAEILLDILPNGTASDYARYNYVLAATALFNQDDILSLEAPGAQVQLVGNLRTVLFLALPGEEQHFSIRVGSNDFTFGGMTFLMVPATLAQMEEIAKLSERKDDLEADYRALSGSLDSLLDALSGIQSGLYASASGLDQLDLARQTFSGGKGVLYDGTDRLRGDLSNLADLVEPVQERIQVLSDTMADSNAVLNELADTSLDLRPQLEALEKALGELEIGTGDLTQVIHLAANMENSLLRLERALGGTHLGFNDFPTNSTSTVQRVKDIHGIYATENQDEFFVKMLVLQGMDSAQAAEQVKQLGQLSAGIAAGVIDPTKLPAEQQAALAAAKEMEQLHTGIQGNRVNFEGFCNVLAQKAPDKISPSQVKQIVDLWTIYSAGGMQTQKPAPEPDPTPDPDPTPNPDPTPDASGGEEGTTGPSEEAALMEKGGKMQLSEKLLHYDPNDDGGDSGSSGEDSGSSGEDSGSSGEDSGSSGEDSGSSGEDSGSSGGDSGSSGDDSGSSGEDSGSSGGDSGSSGEDSGSSGEDSGSSGDDSGSSGEDSGSSGEDSGSSGGDSGSSGDDSGSSGGDSGSSGENPGGPNEGNTVGGAVVDIITSGLDSAAAQINRIQDDLVESLNDIKRPTATVVGNLADLCASLDSLVDDVEDLEDTFDDTSAAIQNVSAQIREILGKADGLRTVLNEYDPTLQAALANAKTLSASAVTTIRDTETLLSDAETLAQESGVQLDEGVRQSLHGLSAALRQTAAALGKTKDVKNAKNTITDIIEDVWNEYTGDVNNLLLMDATAKPVSLTDERNPTPTSIQVLIRTQEIKVEEPEAGEEAAQAKAPTTFWGRIAQMFRDFWNALTGVFH